VSTLDNAIQALFQMAHWDTLWTNASPTSTFAEQDVMVPCAEYDVLMITYRSITTGSPYAMSVMAKYESGRHFPCEIVTSIDSNSQSVQFNFRNCTMQSNRIEFAGGNIKNTSNFSRIQNNAIIIPTAIYGIKL
jgi:hypothetical protein